MMKHRPWIYIIAPYSGKNVTEQQENCSFACSIARRIWEIGGAALCPHMNSFMLDACASHAEFVRAYKRLLGKCDGVVVLGCREPSKGCREEIAHAKRLKLPMYYNHFCEDKTLEEWIKELKIR